MYDPHGHRLAIGRLLDQRYRLEPDLDYDGYIT